MDQLLNKKNSKSKFLTGLIIVLTACAVCGKLFFPASEPVFVFNYANFRIVSPSMEPEYPVNTIVVIKKEPFANLKEGDVIVFKSNALRGGLAFHRITRITEGGVYTKGDGNNHEDNQLITEGAYVGKGILSITVLAYYLSLIHTPAGVILFFALPLSAAVLMCRPVKFTENPNRIL